MDLKERMMRDNQYEYEYHYVLDDVDYIDIEYQDENIQTQHEIQEYDNYYHDIVEELDD